MALRFVLVSLVILVLTVPITLAVMAVLMMITKVSALGARVFSTLNPIPIPWLV